MTAHAEKRPRHRLDAKTRRRKIAHVLGRIVFYLICACLAYQLLYPVLYMLSMAVRDPGDINDPSIVWIPKNFTMSNFTDALKSMNYWKAFGVSMTLSIICGFCDVFSCAVAGYGFARFKFPGKNILFLIVVFTIVVKVFTGQDSINLIGTLWPMIIPSMLAMGVRSGLYIFIYRQFFMGLPVALEDAAYIDGAGPYRTFFSIMLPNVKNAIITVFLFSFVWNWGEYYLSKQFLGSDNRSIMTALSMLRMDLSQVSALAGVQLGTNPEKIVTRMQAGCLLTVAPMLIMFVFTQRFLADSIEHIGIK